MTTAAKNYSSLWKNQAMNTIHVMHHQIFSRSTSLTTPHFSSFLCFASLVISWVSKDGSFLS